MRGCTIGKVRYQRGASSINLRVRAHTPPPLRAVNSRAVPQTTEWGQPRHQSYLQITGDRQTRTNCLLSQFFLPFLIALYSKVGRASSNKWFLLMMYVNWESYMGREHLTTAVHFLNRLHTGSSIYYNCYLWLKPYGNNRQRQCVHTKCCNFLFSCFNKFLIVFF